MFSGVLISPPHNLVGLRRTPPDWQAKSDIKPPKPPDCQSGGVRWSPVQLPSPLESISSQSTRLQWSPVDSNWTLPVSDGVWLSPVESSTVRWTPTGLCQLLVRVRWSPTGLGQLPRVWMSPVDSTGLIQYYIITLIFNGIWDIPRPANSSRSRDLSA